MKATTTLINIIKIAIKCICLASLILVISVEDVLAEENNFVPGGPFSVRNQAPMYIIYLAMEPDMAQTVKKGHFTVDAGYHVSNSIISQQDPWPSASYEPLNYWMFIDAELNRFYADMKYGLSDNLELGINIPYFYYSGGYLDGFIEEFEEILSFTHTPAVRDRMEKDQYEFRLEHSGQEIVKDYSKPGAAGEITVEVKYMLLEEAEYWPTLSIRSALKLPSINNDSSRILGSEKIDYGFGILADKRLSANLFMYGNLNMIFVDTPDLLNEFSLKDYMLSGLLGMEFFLTERTSVILQALANTNVYKEGVPGMEKYGAVLSFGFNHNLSERLLWQIAVDENTSSAAPDFGVFTSLRFK